MSVSTSLRPSLIWTVVSKQPENEDQRDQKPETIKVRGDTGAVTRGTAL